MTELGEHEIFTDKAGKRRLKIKGRPGFPLTMLEGETPEITLERYERKAAEKASQPPPPPAPDPAEPGLGQAIRDKLKDLPPPSPAGDPPPRARKKPSTLKPKPSTQELQKVLEELLVLPAIPFGLPVPDHDHPIQIEGRLVPGMKPRCVYCRDHFITAGPQAAAELAKMSEESEPLRRLLEKVHSSWAMLTFGSVLAGYVMKPALHHLAPEPVLEGLGPIIDPAMPPRAPKPPSSKRGRHAHPAPSPEAAPGDAPGPQAPLRTGQI